MARVLDLTADDEGAEILHRTEGSGGLLGTSHRSTRPIASYLADGESARYVLRNKSAGVTIDGPEGERTLTPGDDYQAFAVVTDRRICFVVGREEDDETVSLPLADVLDASVESAGLLTAALVVRTPEGYRFDFACRGNLDDVAETLMDDGTAWAHAERLLEEADFAIDGAREYLAEGDHDDAFASMDEAEAHWSAALDVLASVHESAVGGLAERIAVRREMADGLRRQVHADAAAIAHGRAQAAWNERDYEAAAAAYERAIESYREAVGRTGSRPTDEGLRRRIAGAAAERAILRAAPVADAETAAGRAAATDDPAEAAEAWEQAHERYRRSLGLEWGTPGRRFAVDREAVREDAATAADRAIDARLEAGRRWLAAADKLATSEDVETARPVYDRATVHFDRAMHVAREVLPDRVGDVEDRQSAVDDRLDGSVDPAVTPEDAPLPVDSVAEALAVVEEDADADESDLAEETPITAVGPAGDANAEVAMSTDDEESEPEATPDDVSPADDDESDPAEGDPPAGEPARESAREDTTDEVETPVVEDAEAPVVDEGETPVVDEGEATGVDAPPVGVGSAEGELAAADDVDRERLEAALGDLEPAAFAELVAEVWSARGWSTTVFTASGSSVYDVLGVDPSTDERLLLWADQRPAGEGLPPATVERIATTRDRSGGGERALVVTTSPVSEATRDRADEFGVAVVDLDGLCDLLVATDLVERVTDREP